MFAIIKQHIHSELPLILSSDCVSVHQYEHQADHYIDGVSKAYCGRTQSYRNNNGESVIVELDEDRPTTYHYHYTKVEI